MQLQAMTRSGRDPAMPTANKAIHTAQGPWPLQGPCLSQAQRHLPGQKSEPKHQPCPTAVCRCGSGSAWGPGHPQLSGNSDSWGGKEPHSPGSSSPRWYLPGPRGPSETLGDPADLCVADSAVDPVTAILLLHHDLALWAVHGLALPQHGPQHLRRLLGSHVVLMFALVWHSVICFQTLFKRPCCIFPDMRDHTCLLPVTLFWFLWSPANGPLGGILETHLNQSISHWGCLIQGKLNDSCVLKEQKCSLLHCYSLLPCRLCPIMCLPLGKSGKSNCRCGGNESSASPSSTPPEYLR